MSDYACQAQRGFLTQVKTLAVSGRGLRIDYTRDARGRITGVDSSLPDGTEDRAYTCDAPDRLSFAQTLGSGGLNHAYAYDRADTMIWNSALRATGPTILSLPREAGRTGAAAQADQ